jgi:hypothetical protein
MTKHIPLFPRSLVLSLAVVGAGTQFHTQLAAQAMVSPADRVRLEGSSSTVYPLGRARTRLQQLIGDIPVAATFQGHAYRRDATTVRGIVGAFRSQITVNASTSPRTPTTASTTFADNQGTPQTLLSQAWISFPQTDRPTGDVASSFELRIPYATPLSWSGTGVLCLETIVHSNDVGGLSDRNFSVYQDSHDLSRTNSRQPGYRYGQGCALEGATTRANAGLDLVRTTSSLDLEVSSRAGAPTDANGPGFAALMLGVTPISWPWPARPECTAMLSPLAIEILGTNDVAGGLDVTRRGLGSAPGGRTLLAQVLTLQPATGAATLSDGTRLVVPALPPTQLLHVRIANGDDHTAATGTVSFSVPVTELF